MSDIVERLHGPEGIKAADEIQRLRRENTRLHKANEETRMHRGAAVAEIARLSNELAQAYECCAQIAEGFPHNRNWVPGSLYDALRREVAAAIRARKSND